MRRMLGLLLVLTGASACNNDAAGNDDAGGNETDDGFGASCPDALPQVDDACEQVYATCTYMRCDDYGVATATCRDDGRWDVETRACEQLECVQETCPPGFICRRTAAGAVIGSCVENTCGERPIGCECPGCAGNDCTANGLILECNACHADICP